MPGVVQRRFVRDGGAVATNEIVDAVDTDVAVKAQLATAVEEADLTKVRIGYIVKKLQEGMDRPYAGPVAVVSAATDALRWSPEFFAGKVALQGSGRAPSLSADGPTRGVRPASRRPRGPDRACERRCGRGERRRPRA